MKRGVLLSTDRELGKALLAQYAGEVEGDFSVTKIEFPQAPTHHGWLVSLQEDHVLLVRAGLEHYGNFLELEEGEQAEDVLRRHGLTIMDG